MRRDGTGGGTRVSLFLDPTKLDGYRREGEGHPRRVQLAPAHSQHTRRTSAREDVHVGREGWHDRNGQWSHTAESLGPEFGVCASEVGVVNKSVLSMRPTESDNPEASGWRTYGPDGSAMGLTEWDQDKVIKDVKVRPGDANRFEFLKGKMVVAVNFYGGMKHFAADPATGEIFNLIRGGKMEPAGPDCPIKLVGGKIVADGLGGDVTVNLDKDPDPSKEHTA